MPDSADCHLWQHQRSNAAGTAIAQHNQAWEYRSFRGNLGLHTRAIAALYLKQPIRSQHQGDDIAAA